MLNEILDKIKNVEVHNSYYFMVSRFKYLKSNERKGYVKIKVDDPQSFLKYLDDIENDTASINDEVVLRYITERNEVGEGNGEQILKNPYKKAIELYDPDKQFILNIICDDEEIISIVNTSLTNDCFYGKTPSPSGNGISNVLKLLRTECIVCKDFGKVSLKDLKKYKTRCSCCENFYTPKHVLECMYCFTKYYYY